MDIYQQLHATAVTFDSEGYKDVCTFADLMVEFMLSHLSKNFKLELYR